MQLATIAQWKAKVERVANSMGMPEIVASEEFRALEGESGPKSAGVKWQILDFIMRNVCNTASFKTKFPSKITHVEHS